MALSGVESTLIVGLAAVLSGGLGSWMGGRNKLSNKEFTLWRETFDLWRKGTDHRLERIENKLDRLNGGGKQ